MSNTIAAVVLALASTVVCGQTEDQREFCRVFASIQRSMATLRDNGVSLAEAQALQRKALEKNPTLMDATDGLLYATTTTWKMGLSPDATEVVSYAICLDALKPNAD